MKILSFRVNGKLAAFRDPSVTSNQTVYHIPSKSAVVGLLGAMIGMHRDDDSLGPAYGSNYVDFFSKISIGIRYESEPIKITYFTNHRSLENANMKPYKKELLQNPQYRVFVLIENESQEYKELRSCIHENRFVYSPCLGHAYCPAIISGLRTHQAIPILDAEDEITDCVILDESSIDNPNHKFRILPARDNKFEPTVIVERHLHHIYVNSHLESRVLEHWIPIKFSSYQIDRDGDRRISKFYKLSDDRVVCMF